MLFIGYPRSTENILEELNKQPWHFDFLEEFVDEEWKINLQFRLDTPEADLKRKINTAELLEKKEKKFVWIQPSLPFITFIFAGFLLEILVGNIIISVMSFFM